LALNSNGAIAGVPTAPGTYGFTVQVSDYSSPEQTAQANLSISIAPSALQITTTEISSGTVNTFYQSQLDASGGTTPYTWTIASGKLPAGLSLNSSGLISGTPTMPSLSSFVVRVADSGVPRQTATHSLTLVIDPTQTLNIPSQQLPDGTVGVAYQASATAAGGIPPYTWAAASLLPPKLMLGLTGEIYGTPQQEGSYQVGLMVKDSATPPSTATVSLPLTLSANPSSQITTDVLPITTAVFLPARRCKR
jgi:hypothetical protein